MLVPMKLAPSNASGWPFVLSFALCALGVSFVVMMTKWLLSGRTMQFHVKTCLKPSMMQVSKMRVSESVCELQ